MELYLQRPTFKGLYLANWLNMNRFSYEQPKIGIYAKTVSVEFQVPLLDHSSHERLPKEKNYIYF